MTKNNEYSISDLSQHLFWDLNINTIDLKKNKAIIIERVLTRGDIADLSLILKIYGFDNLKKEVVKLAYLDKKTLNWASSFFNLKKTDFKCYTKIQSNQIHWNF